MPTSKKSSIVTKNNADAGQNEESARTPDRQAIKRLGIIAGGGHLPERLLESCDKQGIDVFVIGFEGHTNPAIMKDRVHMMSRIGAAGQIIKTLKAHGIQDLVMIGALKRPSFSELRPDKWTAGFFSRMGLKAFGDDGLLKAIKHELEEEGFTLHGVQKFAKELLAGHGPLAKYNPGKADQIDIEYGVKILQATGPLDIGQAVIVQQGIVLGLEATEGTDELIRRCRAYHRKGKGGVLVKLCKNGQDESLDLPTIGPETIRMAHASGLKGIAVHSGKSLLLESQDVAEIADESGIFVTGIKPEDYPQS